MSGFVRISDRIMQAARTLVVGAALACGGMSALQAETPKRVVSINLCTDQLAMLLAGEDQLISVSRLAHDPNSSSMTREAQAYHMNNGLAEEVYLLNPDLVLAGRFTAPHTIQILKDLGIPVVIFEITKTLDGVRDQLAKMGKALNRQDAAARMIADFDARRTALATERGPRPSAMMYYANGFTSGEESLAHEILDLAGFDNASVKAGYNWGMKVPLEVLALSNPDVIVTPQPYPGGSRAEDVAAHPVVEILRSEQSRAAFSDSDWICGTPFVLRAAEKLAVIRREMTIGGAQ
jgi:iron complex transport system substrate-binding protein